MARLHGCTGSPEPLLVAYVISTFFTRAVSIIVCIVVVVIKCDLGGAVARSDVRPTRMRTVAGSISRPATFFRAVWFYYRSLPSAGSRRAVVSYWRNSPSDSDIP